MSIKTLLFSLVLFLPLPLHSQVNLGIKGQFNTSFTDVNSTYSSISNGDAEYGYGVGVYTRIGMNNWMIMPEFLYSSTTSNIKFQENTISSIFKTKLDKIDVPVSLVFRPSTLFNVSGGLVGSYILTQDQNFIEGGQYIVNNYKDLTLGYQFGMGIEISRYLMELRYEAGFDDLGNGQIGGLAFDERQSQIKASLGINLF